MTSKLAKVLGVVPSVEEKNVDGASNESPPSIEGLIDEVLHARTERFNFFRPSMLHGCDRANVFHYRDAPQSPQQHNPRMFRILDNGSAIHSVVQRYIADHHEYWFAPEARIMVDVCGATIRGSCDGVLIRRSDGFRFGVEIKTIKHDDFIKLSKPKPEHVMQALIYCRLQKLPWIVVLYWDKDKQHLKEFPVKYDPKKWEDVKSRIKELYGYIKRGEIPEFNKNTCDTGFCSYVAYCRKKGGPV